MRGAILLLDDTSQTRAVRAEHLTRLGFQVQTATAFEEAKRLWRRNRYVLVLFAVTRDLHRATEFCQEIKTEHPRQMVGMLVPPKSLLPPTRCPDLIWPEEELEYFLARVETLAYFAPAA